MKHTKFLVILLVSIFCHQFIYSETMSEEEAINYYSEAFKEFNDQNHFELKKGKGITDCRLLMYDGYRPPYIVRFYEADNERMLEFLGTKGKHRRYFEGKDLVDFEVKLDDKAWAGIIEFIKKDKSKKEEKKEEKKNYEKYLLRCNYGEKSFVIEEYDAGKETDFINFTKYIQKLVIEKFLYDPIKRWAGILYKFDALYPSKKCDYIQMLDLPCDPKKNEAKEFFSIFLTGGEFRPEWVRIIKDNQDGKIQAIAKPMFQNSRQRGLMDKVVDLNKDDWTKIKNFFDKNRKLLQKADDENKYLITEKYHELEMEYCNGLKCEKYLTGWTRKEARETEDEKKLKNYNSWEIYEFIKDVIFDAHERNRSEKTPK